jgi:hypothetical protein
MNDELDDLSALARRGALSGPEQRRLAMLLESSPESSLLHRAGAELDREDIVLPGDDALAERIAQAALARLSATQEAPAPRRKRRLVLVLLAAALASGALASTLALIERERPAVQPSVAPQPTAPREPPAPLVTPLPLPAPEPARPVVRAPRPVPAVSAAELFAAASRARREGELPKARALYGELTRRFAGTHEAHAARMALGLLELAADPGAALAHFEAYLQGAGDRALRAEALWGKSQALRALGRADEARATLELLVKEAPGSAYAPAARARLAAPAP